MVSFALMIGISKLLDMLKFRSEAVKAVAKTVVPEMPDELVDNEIDFLENSN